jgi:hypothetical protein
LVVSATMVPFIVGCFEHSTRLLCSKRPTIYAVSKTKRELKSSGLLNS